MPTWLCVCRSVCIEPIAREDCTLGRLGFDPWTPFDVFYTFISRHLKKILVREMSANSSYLPNTFLSFFLSGYSEDTGTDLGEVKKGTRTVHVWYLKVSRVT